IESVGGVELDEPGLLAAEVYVCVHIIAGRVELLDVAVTLSSKIRHKNVAGAIHGNPDGVGQGLAANESSRRARPGRSLLKDISGGPINDQQLIGMVERAALAACCGRRNYLYGSAGVVRAIEADLPHPFSVFCIKGKLACGAEAGALRLVRRA